MEQIIDNKNGTYSFKRNGQVLHTGKWGDNYVAPKAVKVDNWLSNKLNPVSTIWKETPKTAAPIVAKPVPKFNLFDFSNLNPTAKLSQPTTPVVTWVSWWGLMPPTINGQSVQENKPLIQPSKYSGIIDSIIPSASAMEPPTDAELQQLIDDGYSDEEIMSLYEPAQTEATAKRENTWFFWGIYKKAWDVANKIWEQVKSGAEDIKSAFTSWTESPSPLNFIEDLWKGTKWLLKIATSIPWWIAWQAAEDLALNPTIKAYKSLMPDKAQEFLSKKTSEGAKATIDWYKEQSPSIQRTLKDAWLIAEIATYITWLWKSKQIWNKMVNILEKNLPKTSPVKTLFKEGAESVSKEEKVIFNSLSKEEKAAAKYLSKRELGESETKELALKAGKEGQNRVKSWVGITWEWNKLIQWKNELEEAKTISKIISPKKTKTENIARLNKAIEDEAAILENNIKVKDIKIKKSDVKKQISKNLESIYDAPEMFWENKTTAERLVKHFEKFLEEETPTADWLLRARKKFDNYVQTWKGGKAFDPKLDNIYSSVLKEIRQTSNNIVDELAWDVWVKASLKKQSNMFNARDKINNIKDINFLWKIWKHINIRTIIPATIVWWTWYAAIK